MSRSNAAREKGNPIGRFFSAVGKDFREIGNTFVEGDWKTKLSFIVMGLGPILRGQVLRGIMYLAIEILFIWFLGTFGGKYFMKLGTLGTVETTKKHRKVVYGDHSFLILLFGLLTLIFIVLLIFLWRMNIRENRNEELALKQGKKLPGNRADFKSLFDSNFDKTLLALPVLGVFTFTVLPIIFMICVAFTNYDATHQAPTKLFTWVGLENFKNLFSFGKTD